MRPSASFNPKIPDPCKALLRLLNPSPRSSNRKRPKMSLRLRTPRRVAPERAVGHRSKKRFRTIFPLLCRVKPEKHVSHELGVVLGSLAESMRDPVPFPSPRTPAVCADLSKIAEGMVEEDAGEGVEEACRCFEKYLVEMIVEEGRVRDLMDVEELIGCWKQLKSPVFVGLVSRFYGEVCMDLFSGGDGEMSDE